MLERIWTVSTLLSLSRIALVVPFAVCLLVDFPNHRLWAAAVIAAGVVTDFLDGYLARRRHEVTDLGKIVDPIADKVGIGVSIGLLSWTGDISWWFVAAVILRDLLIVIGGVYIRRRKKIVVQSNWPGKVAVSALAVLVLLSLVRVESMEWFRSLTLWFSLAMMTVSFAIYVQRLFVGRRSAS